MNSGSNRKIKLERTRTPVHLNSSQYVFKSNSMKKFSPNLSRRPNLNETVGVHPSSSSDPKFKTKLSTNYEVNYEAEYDMAYNDYLQDQMKKQFVEMRTKDHKEILEDQLFIQNENLFKRQQNLREIVKDTESIRIKSEVIDILDFFQDNFINFANICSKYDIKDELNNFKDTLNLECDKIVLRNIKALQSQEEYNKFINTLELCLTATEKITNSGRDFEHIEKLAKSVLSLTDLINTVQKSQDSVLKLEKDIVFSFLQNTSDFFARRYT